MAAVLADLDVALSKIPQRQRPAPTLGEAGIDHVHCTAWAGGWDPVVEPEAAPALTAGSRGE